MPETVGQVARCVYESLALKYRHALEGLEKMKGQRIDSLNIVGGPINNKVLNQLIADSLDRESTGREPPFRTYARRPGSRRNAHSSASTPAYTHEHSRALRRPSARTSNVVLSSHHCSPGCSPALLNSALLTSGVRSFFVWG